MVGGGVVGCVWGRFREFTVSSRGGKEGLFLRGLRGWGILIWVGCGRK